ncbi:MAG: sulfotransferase [Paracoccaceae bacterium]|nr:sulfotransferase [Paracoccaceae bacterium]
MDAILDSEIQEQNVTPPSARGDASDLTIIWHMGFIKTGTTSAQKMLRKSRHAVPADMHLFRKQNDTVDLRLTAKAWRKKPTDENRDRVFAAVGAVRDMALENGAQTAVFSDENIVEFDAYNERDNIFTAAARTLPLIEEAAFPAKSVFVFYTRQFDKWLASAYNQSVKMLRLTEDFDEYCANIPFEKNWDVQKDLIQSGLKSDVVFCDMEDDTNSDLPVGSQVLRVAGAPSEALDKLHRPEHRNESLSPEALRFMLEVNRSNLATPALRKIRRFVMQNPESFS